MAKRAAKKIEQPAADASSAQPGTVVPGLSEAPNAHFVMFHLADGIFGFRLDDVSEIIRVPRLAHMPLGPQSLFGLANLHGVVLPVVGLRRVLGLPNVPLDQAMRVIVIDRGSPVGFVVDRIENLVALPADRIEKDDAGAGFINPEFLDGVIKGAEGDSTIKILNPQRLLREEFSRLGLSASRSISGTSVVAAPSASAAATSERKLSLISFDVHNQEYALPLDRVREIIQLPEKVSEVARSETAVLGVVTLRDRLLPLVSLRSLLGLPAGSGGESGKVVVLSMGKDAVGVVADRTREILHVDPGSIDPTPALLTRGEGDAEIASICRLDHGKRLVALLSPDHLFRSDLVRRVLSENGGESDDLSDQTDGNAMADEQFIIFRLGDQEYGISITAVDEIARPPEQIARLPKAPIFVDGVMNLRGIVVPIVDLRRRFEIMSEEPVGSRRILVLALAGGKTGFMVDSVSEVLRLPASLIRPAPELSPEQMRLIGRVANLDMQNRMILLIDPAQLLDQIETDVLVKFDRNNSEDHRRLRDQTSHR
jgi:purine-binding chemotaxis protein CheW